MTSQTPPQAPGPQAAPPGGPGVASFFDRIRAYGAVRPDEGRWVAGVAAGLARRWGIDPVLVRGGFVLATLFGGVGLLLYGVGWLFLPHPDGRIHAQEVLRGTVTAGFVGGVLCVLADLGGSGWSHGGWYGPRPFGGGLVFVGLIVFAVWWFAGGRHRRGPHGPGGWHGGWGGSGGPGAPTPEDPGSTWTSATPPPSAPAGAPAPGGPSPATPGDAPDAAPGNASDDVSTPATSPTSATSPDEPGALTVPPDPAPTASMTLPAYGTPPPAPTATLVAPAPPVVVRTPPRPDLTRPSHALTRAVIGAALLSAGVVLVLDRLVGLAAPAGSVAAAVALGVIAVGVLVAGVLGRRAGGLAPVGILLAIVTLGAAANTGTITWAGDRTWTPGVVTGTTQYSLGIGDARLDLTNVSAPGATAASPAEIDARVGVGALTVVVPKNVKVRVIADTGNGEVQNTAGLSATPAAAPIPAGPADPHKHSDLDVSSGTDPVVLVRADLGAGRLSIVPST